MVLRAAALALLLAFISPEAKAEEGRCGTSAPIADAKTSELIDNAVEGALGWVGAENLPQRAGVFAIRARAQVLSMSGALAMERDTFARHYIYETCRILTATNQSADTVDAVITALEKSFDVKL